MFSFQELHSFQAICIFPLSAIAIPRSTGIRKQSIYLVPWILHSLVSNALCAFNFTRLIFLRWCYLHPPPTRPSYPGLRPVHVPFLVPVAGFLGCTWAEISIQISALAGVWTSDLGSLMAANVTTRQTCIFVTNEHGQKRNIAYTQVLK